MSRKRKSVPKRSPSPSRSEPLRTIAHAIESRSLRIALRGAGFLLLIASLFALFHPGLRVWGFHHLAFLPAGAAAGFLIVGALLWTPLGTRAVRYLGSRWKALAGRAAIGWAILAAMVFFLLQVAVPLLGDGPLWIKELVWIAEFEARGRPVPLTRFLMRKEPLELGLHELVFRTVAATRPPDFPSGTREQAKAMIQAREQWFYSVAHNTYAYLSILAGALFVYLLIRFARRRIAPQTRAPFLLILFSGTGMLLFFGYVENYTWASLTMVAFLLAGLDDAFPPRRFPFRTLIAFLIAVSFHLMALVLLPAVLYLLYGLHFAHRDENADRTRAPIRRMYVFLMATFAAGLAGYLYVRGWEGWVSVMPLLPTWSQDGYAALTGKHALDLANLFVLIALPSTLILLFVRSREQPALFARLQTGFLVLAAVGGAAFAALFNPNLGMARDWDLLAAALWPFIVLAAWTVARHDFGEHRAEVVAGLMGFAVIVSIPFVLVSCLKAPSLKRYETLLQLDQARSAYGWENLAMYYETLDDAENRIRAWRGAVEVSENPRYKVNLAVALRLVGRIEEAEPYCLQAARENPEYAYQLAYLAQAYARQGHLDKSRDLLTVATELDTANVQIRKILDAIEKRLDDSSQP
ncbi:tetratricopeptide repeat protein [bacterium]|nr:tetratricopeptide repeat protein [bacterium]